MNYFEFLCLRTELDQAHILRFINYLIEDEKSSRSSLVDLTVDATGPLKIDTGASLIELFQGHGLNVKSSDKHFQHTWLARLLVWTHDKYLAVFCVELKKVTMSFKYYAVDLSIKLKKVPNSAFEYCLVWNSVPLFLIQVCIFWSNILSLTMILSS